MTKEAAKGRGMSLHIGLNKVDPKHYQGWDGALQGCENDANDLAAIAEAAGFQSTTVLTKHGDVERVRHEIGAAAEALDTGDFFLLTYSGHGGQVPDANGDEADERDETWVLYDRQLVDDELYDLWSKFRAGVRIVVLSDSCHSGTAVRATAETVKPEALSGHVPRTMPKAQALAVYEANKEQYDEIQRALPDAETAEVGAHVLLLSGCQDNQTSADGARNGLFTETLLGVWNGGKFKGGYKPFYRAIVEKMPPWQSPNWMTVGPANAAFQRRKPFTI
jgi:metacaspase-1